MKCQFSTGFVLRVVAILGVALACPVITQAEGSGKNWALRDHYNFESDRGTFRFDIQTAEWGVSLNGLGDLVNFAYAEIELADGKSFRLHDLKSTSNDRDTFKDKLGSGTAFHSTFPQQHGLETKYSVVRFSDRPFMLLSMKVTNKSDKPVSISSLKPAVFSPGVISGLGKSTPRTTIHTAWRGGFPILHGSTHASLVRFQVPRPKMTLGIGLLQSGEVDSHIILNGPNSALTGLVESRFDPPLQLDPGESADADSIWLSVYIPKSEDVHSHHAWTEFSYRGPMRHVPTPNAWVTVDSDASADDLFEAAKSWSSQSIVRYALVPYGWEGKAGSLQGSTPRYPKDMKKVATTLMRIGMQPGISLDPLAIDKKGSGVLVAADGSRWLHPGNAKAQKALEKRVQKLVAQGYHLFVVPETSMPDDVLMEYKLTRVHAHSLAVTMLQRAVPDAAVVPAPSREMDDSIQGWRQVSENTSSYQTMGYKAGPVRFAINDLDNVSDDLIEAIQDYAGSVEVVGSPSKKRVRTKLSSALEVVEEGTPAQ